MCEGGSDPEPPSSAQGDEFCRVGRSLLQDRAKRSPNAGRPEAELDRVRRRRPPHAGRHPTALRSPPQTARRRRGRPRHLRRRRACPAGCRRGRRPRPAAAHGAAPRSQGPPSKCLLRAPRADGLHGAAHTDELRVEGDAAYVSRRAGRPKSGNSLAVSRKKVNSTIRPSDTSSTCSAHGS
jgi:hypothetical protein